MLRLGLSFALLLCSSPALAGDGLDVEGWLSKPGVKLLAVEFYATWCKPCMEAVPKWKALHDKYRRQGLRLVVVATQDPQAGCASPGWSPDGLVCDDEGALAERFGAKNLPAAYLWGWQGHQLVSAGHVEDVERAIERWLREAPSVDVAAGPILKGVKVQPETLRRILVDELGRGGKFVVVASEAERKKLAELKRRSFEKGYDENLQCEVGKELPPNSLLEVSVTGDSSRPRVALQLRAIETGCLAASSIADLDIERLDASIAEALAGLVARVRTETQLPWLARRAAKPENSTNPVSPQSLDEKPAAWNPSATNDVLVGFASNPPGAVVMVGGELLCQATPCKKALAAGPHSVTMQKEGYDKRAERVTATAGANVEWTLAPAFATLSVTSEPSGLPVFVDGEQAGQTPLGVKEVDPGAHEVWVEDRCHLRRGERFVLAKGDSKRFALSPEARESAIEVSAEDASGNAVEAEVFVDGKRLGTTPGTWKVPLCAEKLEVRSIDGRFEEAMKLEERQVAKVKARLDKQRSRAELRPPLPMGNSENAGADRNRDKAIEELKKLIPKAPETRKAEMFFRLAELYWMKSKYNYGLEMMTYEKVYTEWNDGGRQGKEPEVAKFTRQSELIKQNALKLYEKVLGEFPTYERNDEVLFYLGYNEFETGNRDRAVDLYWKLIKQFPKSRLVSDAYLQLGDHFFNTNRIQKARKAYEHALGTQVEKVRSYALYKLAWCDYNEGLHDQALRRLSELRPEAPDLQDAARELAALIRGKTR